MFIRIVGYTGYQYHAVSQWQRSSDGQQATTAEKTSSIWWHY